MTVTEEGSLVIESVQKQDSGEYICKGLSAAGSAYAKARLEVRGLYVFDIVLCYVCTSQPGSSVDRRNTFLGIWKGLNTHFRETIT